VYYFTVDFLGKISTQLVTTDGRLLGLLEASSPEGHHVVILDEGTRTVDSQGKVVTLIEIRPAVEVSTLPHNKRLVGTAYNFEPSGIVFDKPVHLILGYDIDQLPQNVTSVKLAYYSRESGWVSLEPESDRVAEVGKASAAIEHLTVFAVLAEVPTTPTPAAGAPINWAKIFMWIFIALFLLILLIWWLLKRYVFRFKSRDQDS
jgi:hypothetical protein